MRSMVSQEEKTMPMIRVCIGVRVCSFTKSLHRISPLRIIPTAAFSLHERMILTRGNQKRVTPFDK